MLILEISSKIYEPKTYKKDVFNPIHSWQWKKAIEKVIQNLEDHQTWEFDHLPLRKKAVRSKWVFKVKYALDKSISCYKTRLVIQDFIQVNRINFNMTFSLTVRCKWQEIFLAMLCIFTGLLIRQIDIIELYFESILSDNNLSIFIKLFSYFHMFRTI